MNLNVHSRPAAARQLADRMSGMKKTSMYLTVALKAALGRAAKLLGRQPVVAPTIPLFASGRPDLATRASDHLEGFGESVIRGH
jgi:hypothetical protein